MSKQLSGADLDKLILNGSFTPKQVFLIGDIHDFGSHTDGVINDPRFSRIVKESKQQRQLRRKELGMD
jgi:hypothetical protein